MKAHRLASYFPTMEDEKFEKFKEDIKQNGQLEPIVTFDNQILDGLNRYRACTELGIDPKFRVYEGKDPLHYVISVNVHRRHMSVSQLAMVATEMLPEFEKEAKEKQSEKAKQQHNGKVFTSTSAPKSRHREEDLSRERVAKEFGISGHSVGRAKRIKEQAPEKVAAILAGKESVRSVDTELRLKSAKAQDKKDAAKAVEKKIKETPRAVKEYFDAIKAYDKALDFALEVAKRSMFAEESLSIIQTKHNQIKMKMNDLEELV